MVSKKVLHKIIQKNRYLESKALLCCIMNYNSAIIKGEPLSRLAYGEYGKRMCSDIDILVSKSTLPKIESVLKEQGFTSEATSRTDRVLTFAFSHQVSPWYKKGQLFGYTAIDINFDIFWGEYTGKRIDIDTFLADTVEMEIYGCKVKTLPPLKAMVQLILHHYKEMNSIYLLATFNCIRYHMFQDVYFLWKNNREDITLDKLYTISSEYEIVPYVFYILCFTNQIFKDADLEKYVEAFQTPEGVGLLNCYGLSEKERRSWKVDFQTRLEADTMYELIKEDLTESDLKKVEMNRKVFG